jgi:hypothetical protein
MRTNRYILPLSSFKTSSVISVTKSEGRGLEEQWKAWAWIISPTASTEPCRRLGMLDMQWTRISRRFNTVRAESSLASWPKVFADTVLISWSQCPNFTLLSGGG